MSAKLREADLSPAPVERAHPVDIHVGGRIRSRRKQLQISQMELGERIGVTFQQVQKYELGRNRVSAFKLYDVAKALRTPLAWFFEGLRAPHDIDDSTAAEDSVHRLFQTREGSELVAQFPRLPPRVRRAVLALVREIGLSDRDMRTDQRKRRPRF